ncbi:MAG: hypothetical protein WAO20_16095 [Acidobacteriota bacterium]
MIDRSGSLLRQTLPLLADACWACSVGPAGRGSPHSYTDDLLLPFSGVAHARLEEMMTTAIDRALQARGLRPAKGDQADLPANYLGQGSYRILDLETARAANRSDEWIPYRQLRPGYEGAELGYLKRYGTLSID